MIKQRFIIMSVFLVSAVLAGAIEARGTDTLPRRTHQLIQKAYAQNSRVESLRQKVRETYRDIEPSGSLDNPRLQGGLMNLPVDSYDFNQEPMTSKDLALMQKIPFYGKRTEREKKAIARYRISRAELDSYQVKLAHDVRRGVYNWWALGEIIDLRRDEQKKLESFVDIARSRYETGKGIQADIQRAQARLSRIQDRLLSLKQRRQSARDHLKRIVGGTIPVSLNPTLPDEEVSLTNLSAWKQKLPEVSPRLRADSEQIQAGRSGVRLAELDYYPDVDVGVRYRQREDWVDFASVMVTIPLPIWASQKETPKLQSRQHRLRRYQALYRDRLDELRFQLETSWYEYERIRDQLELYDERLLPEARGTLESTLSAYRVGTVDFVSLLDAELELYRVRIERVRLRSDAATTASQITRILGYERLEAWQ